ncbi:replication protein P [Teredinibacter turnerae]|uniref:replication protein P n=1 Tax=Teredinibacter turnerae TaxID=2426 RepID=UPI00037C7D42|nr:replication protein P [Teredinibacter turnerae]
MKKNSPTAAGPTEQATTEQRIDAINQIFALFRRNYHNQFFKAFSNETDVNAAKRLWMESLRRFDTQTLLRAARTVIENNEFLPTLATMVKACELASQQGLPDAHSAYLEACNAPSPKAAHQWSHPAIYHAGKASDWYFLQTNAESVAFPVFRQHYAAICEQVRLGQDLALPQAPALPEKSATPVDKATARTKMQDLRKSLEL